MRKLTKSLVALAAGGLTVLSLASPASAATPFTPNDSQDWIRMGGSDTTYQLMNDLATLYNEAPGCFMQPGNGVTQQLDGSCADRDAATAGKQIGYEFDGNGLQTSDGNPDHDVAFGYYPTGSSVGISQLNQAGTPGVQYLEVARSSRARRATDNTNLQFVGFARESLPPARWNGGPSAGVTGMTVAQMQGIWQTCTVTNWNQIGGAAGPIIIWAAQAGSGTRASFDEFLAPSGGNATNCIPGQYKDGNSANGERVIFENDAAPITDPPGNLNCQELAAGPCHPSSIFYYSGGRWFTNNPGTAIGSPGSRDGSILMNLNGLAPTEANVSSGAYNNSRTVNNVIRNTYASLNAPNAVRNFVARLGFVCKDDGTHGTGLTQLENPQTGNNYRVDIENTIRQNGFFPLPWQASTTSYCTIS